MYFSPASLAFSITSSMLSTPKEVIRYERMAPRATLPHCPSIIGCGKPCSSSNRPMRSSASARRQAKNAIFAPTIWASSSCTGSTRQSLTPLTSRYSTRSRRRQENCSTAPPSTRVAARADGANRPTEIPVSSSLYCAASSSAAAYSSGTPCTVLMFSACMPNASSPP
ncbi:hypothetical protein SDC9_163007 [bioreactor metagenome]|uniref:Uncharacterized protein n=1 Tax=bioreactor metagenome TaxID=1076179 RepID=A0A645FUA0_9ZZZZ